jgi:dihydrofolate reductase
MGGIVVTEFVSLDGVIEAPGSGDYRHAGWTFEVDHGPGGRQFKFDELVETEAQLLGRVTYEGFAAAWPRIEGTGEFGEKMNSMPKYVVSSTLTTADWNNTTILDGDPAEEVARLKEQIGGVILVAGSAQLVQTLVEHDLVDELRLMVFPVILGTGKRLFGETSDKKPLRLTRSTTVGDGVNVLTYAPLRNARRS